MTTLLLSSNQLGSLTRTERNDYMQEVSDEIADRIKEERALLDMMDDGVGYDFSKDYDYDLDGNPMMFDDDMGIFADDYYVSFDADGYNDY